MKWIDLIALAVWLAVMAYMAPGAWASIRGRVVRRGDPNRLACFVTAGVFVGYIVRSLHWQGEETSGVALRLISIVAAVLMARAAWAYGRGKEV